jgi:hypothetical protein
MAEANVGWGAPRIHGELLKLGIDIGERREAGGWRPEAGGRRLEAGASEPPA